MTDRPRQTFSWNAFIFKAVPNFTAKYKNAIKKPKFEIIVMF